MFDIKAVARPSTRGRTLLSDAIDPDVVDVDGDVDGDVDFDVGF